MARRVVTSPRPDSNNIQSTQDLGAFIKFERTRQGFVRKEAASLLGISDPTMEALEEGKETTSLSLYLTACHMLGISIAATLHDEKDDI